LAALIALLTLLLQALAQILTMIRPGELWAYLIKGRSKKKARGLVYDSNSGIGIPLAKILLFRARDQKLIRVATSGNDGKFALETPPGEEYYIEIKKEGYEMLSGTQARIKGAALAYGDNYSGERFRTDDAHLLFDRVIPLSPNRDSVQLAFNSRVLENINKVLRVLNIPLLIFGFLMSTLALSITKTPYNITVFGLYLLIFAYYLIRIFIVNGRSFGVVVNQATGNGVDLSVVRAISETKGKLLRTTVTNEKGRYTLVLPKGFYKVVAAKSNLVQLSPLSIRVKSNLKPRTDRIVMVEIEREERSKEYSGVKSMRQEGKNGDMGVKGKPESRNADGLFVPKSQAPYSPPPTHSSQPHTSKSQPFASNSNRSFSDSGEIVERYGGEIREIGKNQSKTQQSDENSDYDTPNWKFT